METRISIIAFFDNERNLWFSEFRDNNNIKFGCSGFGITRNGAVYNLIYRNANA